MSDINAAPAGATAFSVRARLVACIELARIQFRTVLSYRVDFIIGVGMLLLQIFMLRVVWTTVYAGRQTVNGVSIDVQLTYLTLATIQFWLFNNSHAEAIPQRIRDGKIAYDLSRPIGFLTQVFAGRVGATIAMLPFAVLALPFAALVGSVTAPASKSALLLYVVSTVVGYAITLFLETSVQLIAFWTLETMGFSLAYRVLAQFFSGALVPLWFMPGWLQDVAQLLPFQATVYGPLSIYVGRAEVNQVVHTIALQIVWLVLLTAFVRAIWLRALHRVVVQGG